MSDAVLIRNAVLMLERPRGAVPGTLRPAAPSAPILARFCA